MKFVFRTDASLDIGTGHVMRCLTLADSLRDRGAECHFICREHPGHLIGRIQAKGHIAHCLQFSRASGPYASDADVPTPVHAHWLGASYEQDVQACVPILRQIQPDWLVVDHYALDVRWEAALRPYCGRLMVVDDLADRRHDCDLLLDQTFGRQINDYRLLVPKECTLLCGSRYALLRPEFAQWRSYSLARREQPDLKRLLITMGGVDRDNATGRILDALTSGCLPERCHITVVMGEEAPWLNQVRQKAAQLPWPTDVLVGVSNMAQLMADSDLAIGAAGATSWERCCLGLPTILIVLADNQQTVAKNLKQAGAARVISQGLPESSVVIIKSLSELRANLHVLIAMTDAAASVVDGEGIERLVYVLFKVDHAVA